MTAIEDFLTDCELRMHKSIDATRTEFNSVRTGRASARCSTGSRSTTTAPRRRYNMATISAPEARLLSIQPYDAVADQGDREGNPGVRPRPDPEQRRQADPAADPALTEERRKELVKVVRRYAEEGKVAIRNVRRDVMKHLEELVKNGEVGDDEERRAEAQVQKLTDDNVKTLDELLKHKEAEIMEV